MTNFTIDLEKQLSKLGKDLQDLVDRVSPREKEVHNFHPDADVTESESLYRIEMDLPGMGKDQIRLSMQNRVITIQGERKIELRDGEKLTRSERKQGGFSRAFALPETADPRTIKAKHAHGVLNITVEKQAGDKQSGGTTIPID